MADSTADSAVIAEGQCFSSWDSFHTAVKNYCDASHEPLVIADSKKAETENRCSESFNHLNEQQ